MKQNTLKAQYHQLLYIMSSVATARASLKILSEHPERVKQLEDISNYMRKLLKEKGIKIIESTTPIIPIYVYEDEKAFIACKMLLERGVYVNPVYKSRNT